MTERISNKTSSCLDDLRNYSAQVLHMIGQRVRAQLQLNSAKLIHFGYFSRY